MPLLIALWDPFIFMTFKNPAEHPTSIPPGKVNFGIEKYPPEFITLEPYDIHFPPSNILLIFLCVLNF